MKILTKKEQQEVAVLWANKYLDIAERACVLINLLPDITFGELADKLGTGIGNISDAIKKHLEVVDRKTFIKRIK
jgi:hypothetical protein